MQQIAAGDLDPDHIPAGIKGWPARGNPYFTTTHHFSLPGNTGSLASFFDHNGDGNFEPLEGDYPSIEIEGCPPDRYPSEMIFWIYNDEGAGAVHSRTGGKALQMEVQVQAFGYQTDDELNNMTFQRYKLINRADELIDSTFFAIWIDPDLGCPMDDYIGCDSANSLMYVYNQDRQHWVYVSRTPYDACEFLRSRLNPDYWASTLKNLRKTDILRDIAWTGMLTLPPGQQLQSRKAGLIPAETVVSVRVENPFQVKVNTGNGHPKYRFRTVGKSVQPVLH